MEFFSGVLQIYIERWPWFLELLGEQLRISLLSILISGSIGLLLGIFIAEHRRFAEPIIGVCNVFYTIPATDAAPGGVLLWVPDRFRRVGGSGNHL